MQWITNVPGTSTLFKIGIRIFYVELFEFAAVFYWKYYGTVIRIYIVP